MQGTKFLISKSEQTKSELAVSRKGAKKRKTEGLSNSLRSLVLLFFAPLRETAAQSVRLAWLNGVP
jgi:hypothetical protein